MPIDAYKYTELHAMGIFLNVFFHLTYVQLQSQIPRPEESAKIRNVNGTSSHHKIGRKAIQVYKT